MKQFRSRAGLLALICAFLAAIVPTQSANAAATPVCAPSAPTTYRAAEADRPASVVIECPFAGSPNDRVYVYDRGGDMRDTGNWPTATNFENDVWIFDAGGDGKANLIISFHRDGQSLVADMYDDQNNDAAVDYQIRANDVVITESKFWTVRVVAKDGWWSKGDKVNFNLDISIDGMVVAMPIVVLDIYKKITPHDGIPDQIITVRDPHMQGRPDLDIRQAPSAKDYGVVKTAIMKDYGARNIPMNGSIFWPYLGSAYGQPQVFGGTNVLQLVPQHAEQGTYGLVRAWNSFPAPIQALWKSAQLKFVGEFTASRAANTRFIYSLLPLAKDTNAVSELDFENPYDFYDLANANDGAPDLQIRFESFGPHDPNFQNGTSDQPSTLIRYSWDREHDNRWDYKLSLTGRHPVNSIVQYDAYKLQSLPRDEVPYWVSQKTWDAAVFVQSDSGYIAQEGIYEWDTLKIRDNYITGRTSQPDTSDFATIEQGYRGEYTVAPETKPLLYFSPIDRKLHLVNAQEGKWNIDGARQISYKNLGGEYINEWVYSENGKARSALRLASGYLIYTDESGMQLARTNTPASLFTTLPPRNHDEWQRFGQQMAANERGISPIDFEAMFKQFEAPTQQIRSASVRDFRLLANGFRFVLDLQPGFEASGVGDLRLEGLAAGQYVVTFDGAFKIAPLTPPRIVASVSHGELSQLASAKLKVELNNLGGDDFPPATLELWSTSPQGETTMVITQTVSLLAQNPVSAVAQWAPVSAGTWQITPKLRLASGELQSLESSQITVPAAEAASSAATILASVSPQSIAAVGILIAAFAVLGAFIFMWQWRQYGKGQTNDAAQ